jgi:hypothetical protein
LDDEDDSGLYDAPSDFMTAMATTRGVCNGQSILPEGDHFLCQCSCGWRKQVPTKDAGLRLARAHTNSL